MLAWNEYCGFSLLCYLQRECNYRFTENGVHHKFLKNPPGFKIKGERVQGFSDFSVLPNIYPWEKRDEWAEVAYAQSILERELSESSKLDQELRGLRGLRGYEGLEWTEGRPGEWLREHQVKDDFYAGPDIFLRNGKLVDYFGHERVLLGIEKFSVPLTLCTGVLSNEDIRLIGDYALLVDKMCWTGGRKGCGRFGLNGKFVDTIWNISQFQPSGIRGELYMIESGSRGRVVAGSSCDGKFSSLNFENRGVFPDFTDRRHGKIHENTVRAEWCVELYRLFFETISFRLKN